MEDYNLFTLNQERFKESIKNNRFFGEVKMTNTFDLGANPYPMMSLNVNFITHKNYKQLIALIEHHAKLNWDDSIDENPPSAE